MQARGLAALPILRAALKVDPYREDLNGALMDLLFNLDRWAELAVHFRQYRLLLRREADLDPPQKMREMYRRVRAGNSHRPTDQGSISAWHSRDRPL